MHVDTWLTESVNVSGVHARLTVGESSFWMTTLALEGVVRT
ncbi:MAG: hypothetical protein RSD57_15270 [Comamonas sp.]